MFIDFSRAKDRNRLLADLQMSTQRAKITFEKDSGEQRTITCTLSQYVIDSIARDNSVNAASLNTPRSIFLRVYDIDDKKPKTIRWAKIKRVEGTANSDQTAQIARAIPVPRTTSRQSIQPRLPADLVQDLRDAGFINGQQITDTMLMKFAQNREERVRKELDKEIRKLRQEARDANDLRNRDLRVLTEQKRTTEATLSAVKSQLQAIARTLR
jgi:hypothetical protein